MVFWRSSDDCSAVSSVSEDKKFTSFYSFICVCKIEMRSVLICTLGLVSMVTAWDPIWLQPEQVHLSATGDPTQMMVTWSTFNDTKESTVEFGFQVENMTMTAYGSRTKFVDGGPEKHTQYIHRVTLTNLMPGLLYMYRCGSSYGWSSVFYFRALPSDPTPVGGIRLAVYGDMGNENAQSLGRLQVEAQSGMYDAILHVGDFAYDMENNNGRVGDEFMRQIETAAAYVPYMTCPGNHENAYNFSNYKNRFTMPMYEEVQSLWYSWNIGTAHIISFSTEVNFYLEYGQDVIKNQMAWLQKDLQEATKPENRAKHPWIIAMGHKPMYCGFVKWFDCNELAGIVRTAYEDLFYKYGVDLYIGAHEHNYERMWPIYNNKIYNGSMDAPYTNPKAPVHIITGSAGNKEGQHFLLPPKPYTAFQTRDFGYTRFFILNSTHIHAEQVSDDKGGQIIDKFTLIKNLHGPEAWL
ncbi:acid phosphatase type 7-like [Amphiura filiformis]|uniref:acid phosphatase type 7-like n=1 Tax=Amphiura filiformis TaxID=82378 RepID=UPI003B21039F